MRLFCVLSGGVVGLLVLGALTLATARPQHPQIKPPEGSTENDFAACTQCHADKTSGPVVHPALELGCGSCHQVEQDEEETEIRLAAEGNELCFTCHGDKQPASAQLFPHAPLRSGRCTDCHDPHSTQAAQLLRRGTESRAPAENLCLGCHAGIAAQLEKPVQHAAVDLGCATCHTTHKSDPAGQSEGIFHLTKAQPELCLDCHDASDASLQAAHLNQPFASARCSECHNPHGSERAKLINNFVHFPFAEKQCDACHEAPQEGKVVLLDGGRRELCLTCHSDMEERLEKATVKHAALAGELGCVACHSPHAATYPRQVRRGPVDLCLGCHTNRAQERAQKAYLHRPAFQQSCLICHQEHTGERPRRLRAEVNDLCLECHGSQNLAKFRSGGMAELFGDTVEVDTSALSGMRVLSIRAGATRGHPFGAHPVAMADPMNCVTCHNPHAANGSPKLLVTETANSTALCVQCHK